MNLDDDPIAEISKAIRNHRQLAIQAISNLEAALPVLCETLAQRSGQSAKVPTIIQSVWNGDLSDNLASLDAKVAKAVIAFIAARAHCGGDADSVLHPLLNLKGVQHHSAGDTPIDGHRATVVRSSETGHVVTTDNNPKDSTRQATGDCNIGAIPGQISGRKYFLLFSKKSSSDRLTFFPAEIKRHSGNMFHVLLSHQ